MKLSYQIDMDPNSQWIIADSMPAPLYVQEIGDFSAGKGYFTEREGFGSYLLKYTISGGGVLEYDGGEYELQPGQFFLIDCRHRQKYYTSPKSGHWRVLWVHFYGSAAEEIYRRFQSCSGVPVRTLGEDSPVVEQLFQLLRLCGQAGTAASDLRQQGLLQMILSACIESATEEAAGGNAYARLARDFLAAHFAESISLEMLGQAVNVSGNYLQRLFHRQYGVSPLEYQRRLRLVYVKELLRTTTLPISEIAACAGFSSAGYLVRIFRKADGITPAAYRRQWRAVP